MESSNSKVVELPRKLSHGVSRTRRKLSIPVLSTQGAPPTADPQAAFRRRFSNVGDVVSRKLSTTIGWRSNVNAAPPKEIIAVGRALCTLYVRTRLKKAGLFNKKLGLTRVRSAVGSLEGCSSIVREVFPGLACAGQELERMHPKLYTKIFRHTGPPSADGNAGLLLAIGHHILRTEITWGKVVAVFCIAGGLAVDNVRQGQNDQLHVILEDMTELLEDNMAYWVNANGGWTGLNAHCRLKNQEVSVSEYVTLFGFVSVILLVVYFVVRFCIKFSG